MSYSIATLRSWMNQDLLTCPIVSCLKATVFNELSCGIMIIVPYSLSIWIWISPLIGIDPIRMYTAVDTVLSKTKTKTKKPLFYLDNIFNNLLIFNTVLTKVLSDFIVLASILHDLTLTKSTQNIRVPQIDVRAYHPTETCVQKITQAPHRLNHLWIKSILCLVCCLRYCMSGCWLQNDSNFYHATNNVSSCQLTAAMPARRHHEWHWILWGQISLKDPWNDFQILLSQIKQSVKDIFCAVLAFQKVGQCHLHWAFIEADTFATHTGWLHQR